MISASQAKGLSDSVLDSMYADAFDAKRVQDAATLELEILDRLQSVTAFVSGIFGFKRFPLYDSRGHFQQTISAQTAVTDSAKNVATTVVNATSSTLWKIAVPVVIVLLVFLYFKKKAGM